MDRFRVLPDEKMQKAVELESGAKKKYAYGDTRLMPFEKRRAVAQAQLTQTLEDVERMLDDYNAEYGIKDRLCLYCGSSEYNSVHGIVHKDDCPITIIRQELKATLKEANNGGLQ